MKNEKLFTNADQLIDFIRFLSAIPEMGSETTKIKMGFHDYFQSFINKHIKDPKLREKLRSIPIEIQPKLDVEGNKKLAIDLYRTAVINFILTNIIQEQHQQFFSEQKIEEAQEILEKLIKNSRMEKEDSIAIEEYIRTLVAQNHEIELMAILALSLSIKEMENKINTLEEYQIEVYKELYEAFHHDLTSDEIFDNLKDIHGNAVVVDEAARKEIIQSVVKNYADGFTNYCVRNNAIPLNNPPNNQANPLLPARQNQNNDLFDRYHQENRDQFRTILSNSLRNRNVHMDNNAPEVRSLGERMHTRAQEEKRRITTVTSTHMQLDHRAAHIAELKARLARKRLENGFRA